MLEQNELDHKVVKCSIHDLKADEAGLLKYCEDNGLTPIFYSSAELLEVPETSPFCVCAKRDRCGQCMNELHLGVRIVIVKKTALNGVTVAVAAEKLEVRFG